MARFSFEYELVSVFIRIEFNLAFSVNIGTQGITQRLMVQSKSAVTTV